MKSIKGFTLAEVLMAKGESGNKCLHLISRTNEPKEPTINTKFKVAFTLAEVLITLAIIGVVAALTIPALITNYQKHQYVTQLKKNYSVLSNGFRTIIAKDGVTKLSDTTLWSKIGDAPEIENFNDSEENRAFISELSKTFGIVANKMEHEQFYKTLNMVADCDRLGCSNVGQDRSGGLVLKDGTILYYYLNGPTNINANEPKAILGYLFIDVNGDKSPNIMGRDYFELVLHNDASLTGREDWIAGEYEDSCNSDENNWGDGCVTRIIKEGWQMKY